MLSPRKGLEEPADLLGGMLVPLGPGGGDSPCRSIPGGGKVTLPRLQLGHLEPGGGVIAIECDDFPECGECVEIAAAEVNSMARA